MLRFLQQQGMDVDAGVDLWLLIQQTEGQRHRGRRSVLSPNSGAEATVAFRQHEVLLAIAGSGAGILMVP